MYLDKEKALRNINYENFSAINLKKFNICMKKKEIMFLHMFLKKSCKELLHVKHFLEKIRIFVEKIFTVFATCKNIHNFFGRLLKKIKENLAN